MEVAEGAAARSGPGLGDLQRAARAALELVPDRGGQAVLVGLGSGRAAAAFVRELGARVREGLRVCGVPTSAATAALARTEGIPLVGLEEVPLDLTVDGADEVDPDLNLIKGYGGALTRERIVAAASRRQVILVTPDKLVPRLGTRGRLPVEVLSFARAYCLRELAALGLRPAVRLDAEGHPVRTDNGHLLVDCAVEPLADPAGLERALRRIPGVVDCGLFLQTADTVLVGGPDGVQVLRSPGRST